MLIERQHDGDAMQTSRSFLTQHKYLTVWLIALLFISSAAAIPQEKDDRDVVHEAKVFHIMLSNRTSADAIHSKLLLAPKEHLFDEFKALAISDSKDPGSASLGGDLGVVREGEMVRAFEDAVFSQPISTVSSPVKSPFGWHLIYVTSKTEKPVFEICNESLMKTLSTTKPSERPSLQFTADNKDFKQLQSRLLKIIGGNWSTQYTDWNDNLTYVRKLPQGLNTKTITALTHTEYLHPIYNANPLSCKRSAREIFEINCQTQHVSLMKREEFEGRGAIGKKLSAFRFTKGSPSIGAGPSGYYKQLVSHVCSK
jgi:hypothetical protein